MTVRKVQFETMGPRSPKNSPVSMRRSRESTAVKLSKVLVRFLVSIISVHSFRLYTNFSLLYLKAGNISTGGRVLYRKHALCYSDTKRTGKWREKK